ncbi:MoaD/ThiS family protein [Pseudarthrobacter sp. SSS035]|uniref:MoaD/ThiS family protein n=1 Tax=Pseudarthrobacter sp. SSS035 TaxID=2931399 RepID=UPI00200C0129|nr:MoaD/ThiS family protein [Pseudarthrobacter sp. SSS035]
MLVRYFAAAMHAAQVAEETIACGDVDSNSWAAGGVSLGALLDRILELHPDDPTRPSLAQVLDRSSFLVDEVSVRDRNTLLAETATVDILPPFAGG